MIINDKKSTGVAILTGGLSSRMGYPKAELEIKCEESVKTFLEKLCDEFCDFDEKYVSMNSKQKYTCDGYTAIIDEFDGIGPIGGIWSVLNNSKADAVFFLACDMPLFTKEAAEFFISKWDGSKVAISYVNGIRQPLAAIYTKDCLAQLKIQLANGQYKPGMLIDRLDGQRIDMSSFEKCFTNVNTLEDYEKLEK